MGPVSSRNNQPQRIATIQEVTVVLFSLSLAKLTRELRWTSNTPRGRLGSLLTATFCGDLANGRFLATARSAPVRVHG